jgi:hypothetical protein
MHVSGKVVLLTLAAEDAVRRWRFSPDSDTSETEVQIDFTPSGQ